MFGTNTYKEDIKLFQKITTNEAEEFISTKKNVVIYIGRESCPFCRKFVKKLSGLAQEINTTIHYLDSEDMSDHGLRTFRDKYKIITVPGFIVSKGNSLNIICDSSTPEDVILEMIR